jgi:betaine lipid synthase
MYLDRANIYSSLSMIPDFYSVIDSMSALLSPFGILGVADFYVQSGNDIVGRNYTGGVINRHVNWLSRVFWRGWFDIDRVALEPGRRDYLEYRFGTILSADDRNYLLGGIPFYIWIGCQKKPASSLTSSPNYPHEVIERLDAAVTESPYLSAVDHQNVLSQNVTNMVPPEIRSKAFNAAILNLSANLPLPSFFYQNHHWRIHYDDQLKKHTQFNNEYIYAFTWEDVRVDQRLLKLNSQDVVLAITSAGDNILAYALEGPKRIHAVDLNPTQNHLLELKVASFTALGYSDVWKMFGEGKHAAFRETLINKLSPHMSSRAFQYWMDNTEVFQGKNSNGLYETGGSRVAIKLVKWLFRCLGLGGEVRKLCEAKTMNEQREIWKKSVRPILLSRILSWTVIGNEKFLWKALGVPKNQRDMIFTDYYEQEGMGLGDGVKSDMGGRAIWEYLVNTLDPVCESTLLLEDNYFYLLCLQGKYSQRCQPPYLTPRAHIKLSQPNAFDGLRIHTDEINEVIDRIATGTLTVAVVMDSMDWFTPGAIDAAKQITAINRALKLGGRVLLRSAGLRPWYIKNFEQLGFTAKRVGARIPGTCIDR